MDTRFSPCTAHIDLGCIRRNLQRLPAPAHKIMPVIKSDAYGHGLVPVARTLDALGVRSFAVGTVDEALTLRRAGFGQELVTLLGAPAPEAMQAAVTQGVTPLVFSFDQLDNAASQSSAAAPVRVVIKCESGMGRLGFTPEQLPALIDALRTTPWVQPVLALSHFACADMPEKDACTRAQADVFFAMAAALRDAFPAVRYSACNSAAALAYPQFHGDVLRPGEALYGGNPLHGTAWAHLGAEFEPAMSVSTPVLHTYTLQAGQGLSYGHMFVASAPTRIAVLGIGYADGFARHLSERATACIGGRRVPLRGRVCMGMVMADITALPEGSVSPGTEAWLLGGAGEQAVRLQELADIWGTIPYEVQCLLGGNIRVYTE